MCILLTIRIVHKVLPPPAGPSRLSDVDSGQEKPSRGLLEPPEGSMRTYAAMAMRLTRERRQ